MKKYFCIFSLVAFFSINSAYAVCNSPCENPCAPSHTVCQGNNCTTYCGVSPNVVSTTYTFPRHYSIGYSSPFGSFRISDSFIGINLVSRPKHNFRPAPPIRPAQPPRRR